VIVFFLISSEKSRQGDGHGNASVGDQNPPTVSEIHTLHAAIVSEGRHPPKKAAFHKTALSNSEES
jgi:hypothetical protein